MQKDDAELRRLSFAFHVDLFSYDFVHPDLFDDGNKTCRHLGLAMREQIGLGQNALTQIDGINNLKRGDLVFFNTVSDSDLSDHAGVYIGEGYFIHASSGAHKVVVSNLTTGYYGRVFSWGRRILK
jgi:hypothetical protein